MVETFRILITEPSKMGSLNGRGGDNIKVRHGALVGEGHNHDY